MAEAEPGREGDRLRCRAWVPYKSHTQSSAPTIYALFHLHPAFAQANEPKPARVYTKGVLGVTRSLSLHFATRSPSNRRTLVLTASYPLICCLQITCPLRPCALIRREAQPPPSQWRGCTHVGQPFAAPPYKHEPHHHILRDLMLRRLRYPPVRAQEGVRVNKVWTSHMGRCMSRCRVSAFLCKVFPSRRRGWQGADRFILRAMRWGRRLRCRAPLTVLPLGWFCAGVYSDRCHQSQPFRVYCWQPEALVVSRIR